MRNLIQPRVLLTSGGAALLSASACYPRLALWLDRPDHLGFLWLVLGWVSFVLWSFVFAWPAPFANAKVFHVRIPARAWWGATLSAMGLAVAFRLWVDPVLRRFTPDDYPNSLGLWGAMTGFDLAFDQLFLCFAPFAFFMRLFAHRQVATVATVLFGLLIMALKVSTAAATPPLLVLLGLLLGRILIGWLTVRWYLAGGVFLAWGWRLLLEARHLPGLL